jgi:surfeit locus 1 family protein
MRLRPALALAVVVATAATSIRLGFWQLSRYEEKRALLLARQAAAAAPLVRLGPAFPPAESLAGRRVSVSGRYDETRQLLLAGRGREGEPGVEVVTPLRTEGGTVVLVNRGWLPAPDGATASPQDFPEPGPKEVLGEAEPLSRGHGFGMRAIAAGPVVLYSTRGLDPDTLAARLPYRLAPLVVRQSPGPGVPDRPARAVSRPLDESRHLGYAIQWFSFAAILVAGSAALIWTRRRPGRGAAPGPRRGGDPAR